MEIEFKIVPYTEIKCPRCASEFIHQTNVIIYDREEDEKETKITLVKKGKVTQHIVPSSVTCNPSSRRHALAIQFLCENCDDFEKDPKVELTIEQHKGRTMMKWREVGTRQ